MVLVGEVLCGGVKGKAMSLKRRKRKFHFRPPELVAFFVVGIAVISAALWAHENFQPNWQESPAVVTYGDVYNRSYSASAIPDQVHVTYQYDVLGQTYTDIWNGYWPQAGSPNALATERLPNLRQRGYPLSIVFDPANPARNVLHYAGTDYAQTYERIGLAAMLLALGYLAKVYPAWKWRRS